MTSFVSGASLAATRAVTACAMSNGIVLPDWQRLVVSKTNSGATSIATCSTPFGANPVLDGLGFSSASEGTDGTVWLLSYGGHVLSSTDGLTFTNPISGSLPSGETYIGLVTIGTVPFIAAASGRVFKISSGSVVELTPNFGSRVGGLVTDGTRLLAPFPGSAGNIGVLTVSGTPVLTTYTAPMGCAMIVAAASSGNIAVGGFSASVQTNGTGGIAIAPGLVALSNTSAGSVTLLTGADPEYQSHTPLTGLAGAGVLCWSADAEQVLAAVTAGTAILTLVSGALTLSQTLSPTGVTALAVTPSGDEALACRPGANQISVLINTLHTWSVGTPVSVTSPNCVLMLSNVSAVVGTSTGYSYLSRSGSTWSVASSVSLGAAVTALAAAPGGGFYAATGGQLYTVASGGAHTAGGTWTGSANGIVVQGGEIAVLDSTSSLVRWFDFTATLQQSQSVPSGSVTIAMGSPSIWVVTSSGAYQYSGYAPFNMRAYRVGIVAASTNGTSWGAQTLGVGFTPSAVAWSGTSVQALTVENDFLVFGAASLPTLGSPTITTLSVYSGQATGVSLGANWLVPYGGHTYTATLNSGYLVEIA